MLVGLQRTQQQPALARSGALRALPSPPVAMPVITPAALLARSPAAGDALGRVLAEAVVQRAALASRGAAPAALVQRTLRDARDAVYAFKYPARSASPDAARLRAEFDAEYDTWEKLQALQHSFPPREWSRIRALYQKIPPPPPPRPRPAGSVPPPPPPRRPAVAPPVASPPGRKAPSPEEWARVQKRGQIGHVLRDVQPIVAEFLAEIELQRRFQPSEILANRMTLILGGLAKIALGSVQLGTAGLSAPITGSLIALVDLGTSNARTGLGLDQQSGGEAASESGAKSLMVSSATRAIGPVAPFQIGDFAAKSAIPVVGGAIAIGLGIKDIYDGAQGIRLSQEDIVFMRHSLLSIAALKSKVLAKADEMAAIPELGAMTAKWRSMAATLGTVEKDMRELIAAKAPKPSSSPSTETVDAWSAPATRARSGGGPPPLPQPA
jgi:hypothetical protein